MFLLYKKNPIYSISNMMIYKKNREDANMRINLEMLKLYQSLHLRDGFQRKMKLFFQVHDVRTLKLQAWREKRSIRRKMTY